eukprot:jgi/Chlat1/3490/Chrsp23S03788
MVRREGVRRGVRTNASIGPNGNKQMEGLLGKYASGWVAREGFAEVDAIDGGIGVSAWPVAHSLSKKKRWLLPKLLAQHAEEAHTREMEESNQHAERQKKRKPKQPKVVEEASHSEPAHVVVTEFSTDWPDWSRNRQRVVARHPARDEVVEQAGPRREHVQYEVYNMQARTRPRRKGRSLRGGDCNSSRTTKAHNDEYSYDYPYDYDEYSYDYEEVEEEDYDEERVSTSYLPDCVPTVWDACTLARTHKRTRPVLDEAGWELVAAFEDVVEEWEMVDSDADRGECSSSVGQKKKGVKEERCGERYEPEKRVKSGDDSTHASQKAAASGLLACARVHIETFPLESACPTPEDRPPHTCTTAQQSSLPASTATRRSIPLPLTAPSYALISRALRWDVRVIDADATHKVALALANTLIASTCTSSQHTHSSPLTLFTALGILRSHRWDVLDSLSHAQRAHLTAAPSGPMLLVEGEEQKQLSCPVCLEGEEDVCVANVRVEAPECGHWACEECWRGYIGSAMREGRVNINCPIPHCQQAMDELIAPLMDEVAIDRYTRILTDQSPLAPLSSSPLPPIRLEVEYYVRSVARNLLYVGSSGSGVTLETRACPACSYPINKDGGCNHMVCSRCQFAFCWVCRASWEPSHYNCVERESLGEMQEHHFAVPKDHAFVANMRQRAEANTTTRRSQVALAAAALRAIHKYIRTHRTDSAATHLHNTTIEALDFIRQARLVLRGACIALISLGRTKRSHPARHWLDALQNHVDLTERELVAGMRSCVPPRQRANNVRGLVRSGLRRSNVLGAESGIRKQNDDMLFKDRQERCIETLSWSESSYALLRYGARRWCELPTEVRGYYLKPGWGLKPAASR